MAQSVQTALQVDPQQGDDRATGEASAPLKTICQALRLAGEGTVIRLSAGQYSVESGEEFPLQIPAGVTLLGNISTRGAEIVITGGGAIDSPTFGLQTVTLLLGAPAQIRGITVTNPLPQGTGIWVEAAQPTGSTIAHCTIAHCEREGILVAGAAIPAITNCLLQANRASGIAFVRYARGEVRRCAIRENRFGIVLSDRSAPLLVDNQINQNQTGILISGAARPILRHNTIAQNSQKGLAVAGAAQPDLGNPQDPANNRLQENGAIDLHNHTATALNTVGNQLNPLRVKGAVNFLRVASAAPPPSAIAPVLPHRDSLLPTGLIEPSQLDSFSSRNHFVELMLRSLPSLDHDAGNSDPLTDRPLTRLDAIALLTQHLGLITGNLALLDVYRDRAQIPDRFASCVAAATQHRLIALPSGVFSRENRLQPLQPIRQAEAAAMLDRAIEMQGEAVDFSRINFATVQISPANVAFGDIHDHWATDFIRAVAGWGAIAGDESGNFLPDQSLSGSEYAQIFGKAADPEQPPQPVSRLQVWRSLLAEWQPLGLQLPEVDLTLLDRYEDAVVDSDATAIALATQLHLVFNYPLLRQLRPNQSVTRAEMAAIVYQLLHHRANAPAIACPYLIDPDRAEQPQPRIANAPRFVRLELQQEAIKLEPISLISPIEPIQADSRSLEAIATAVTHLLQTQAIEVIGRSSLPTDPDSQDAEAKVGIALMSPDLPDRIGVAVFHPIGTTNARLAQALHKTVLRSLDLPSRGIYAEEAREASEVPAIPTARIEIGRVTYPTDRPDSVDLHYCQAVGQAIGEAICQFFDSI